jgi:hypothetical protein
MNKNGSSEKFVLFIAITGTAKRYQRASWRVMAKAE